MPTPSDQEQARQLRCELADRNAAHVPEWYLMLNEAEVADLASGYVPHTVVAMARYLLEQADIDRRRAERPARKSVSKG